MSKTNSSDNESVKKRYEGYSDFEFVSRRNARSIDAAIKSYAVIDSYHIEGAPLEPEQIAEARANILSAAMQLVPELEDNKDNDEEIKKILNDWVGEEGGRGKGYLEQLRESSLYNDDNLNWLAEFVAQIRQAGFMLGYLKAGREIDDEDEEWTGSVVDDIL